MTDVTIAGGASGRAWADMHIGARTRKASVAALAAALVVVTAAACAPPEDDPVVAWGYLPQRMLEVGKDIDRGVYVSNRNDGFDDTMILLDANRQPLAESFGDRGLADLNPPDVAFVDVYGLWQAWRPWVVGVRPDRGGCEPVHGTYVVGSEIRPGRYRFAGFVGGPAVWGLLRDVNARSTIAYSNGPDPAVMLTIGPNVTAVDLKGDLCPATMADGTEVERP